MVEIYIHFLADQKNCISIDLRGAQVNEQSSYPVIGQLSSGYHPKLVYDSSYVGPVVRLMGSRMTVLPLYLGSQLLCSKALAE